MFYSFGDVVGVLISVRAQAVMKSERWQMFQFTIEKDVAQQVSLCNEGVKDLEVSSLRNEYPEIISVFTHVSNNTAGKMFFILLVATDI